MNEENTKQTPDNGVTNNDLLDAVGRWAEEHLEREETSGLWSKTWWEQEVHTSTKLALMKHDRGYWVIIGQCPFGYTANADQWKYINFGTVDNIDRLDELLEWLNLSLI